MRTPFFLGLLILSAPIVQAQNAAVDALPLFLQSRVVDGDPLMDFRTQSVPQGQVDRDTGVLRAAYRLAPPVSLGVTHEATARAYLDAEVEALFQAEEDLYDGEKESVLREKLVAREYLSADDDVNLLNVASGLVLTILFGSPIREGLTDDITVSVGLDAGVATADIPVEISVTDGTAKEGTDYHVTSDLDPLVILVGDSEAFTSIQIQTINDNIGEGDETIVFEVSAPGLTSASQNLTITDNETVTIEAPAAMKNAGFTLTLSQSSANEDDGNVNLVARVTADAPPGENITMYLGRRHQSRPGVAVEGNDYTVNDVSDGRSANVGTLGANFTDIGFLLKLTIIDDDIPEGDETITIIIALDPEYTNIILAEDFTITDDDAAPSTSLVLTLSQSGANEDDDNVNLVATVTADPPPGENTAMYLGIYSRPNRRLPGMAEHGSDYTVNEAISTQAGVLGANLTQLDLLLGLTIIDDDILEGDETITIIIALDPEYTNIILAEDFTITDDDAAPTIALSVSPSSVAEDVGPTDVTVTATVEGSTRFSDEQTVAVTVGNAGDSAVEGTDYETEFSIIRHTADAVLPALSFVVDLGSPRDQAVSVGNWDYGWSPGEQGVIPDHALADDVNKGRSAHVHRIAYGVSSNTNVNQTRERTRSVLLVLNSVGIDPDRSSNLVHGIELAPQYAQNPMMLHFFTNSGSTPDIIIPGPDSPSAVDLRDDREHYIWQLDTDTASAFDAWWLTYLADTANLDDMNVAFKPFLSITIPAGDASGTGTFTLAPVDDVVFEGEEALTVSGLLSGVTVTSTEVTITDDESEPSLTLSAAPSMVAENAVSTTVTVTATLDGSSRFPGAETVAVTVGESGDSAVEGTDYAVVDGFSITIPSGDASATATFPLAPIQDALFEEEETLTVSGLLSGVTVTSTEVTITDDESEPSLTLSAAPSMVAENAVSTTVTVTATLDGSSRFPGAETVAVTVGESGDSAVEGTDYAVVDGFSITIPSGDASATATFPLAPIQDALFEEEETLTVSGLLSGVTVTSTEVTITDDESEPSLTLSVAPSMVAENAVSTTVTVTATLDGSSRFPGAETVAVTVGESGDSAVEGTDYAVVDGFSITIPSGDASATATFPLAPIQDALFEEEETLTVSGLLSGVTVTSTEVTITDDESEPSLTLSAAPSMVAENAVSTTVTVTATLDGSSRFPGAETVAVTVGESGDSAVEGTDYAVVDGFSITIPSGDASATATFPLAPIQDALFEEEETLTVSGLLSGVTVTSTEVTITDDESEPSLTLSAAPSMVAENAVSTTVTVTATLDGSSRFPGAETVAVTVGESGDSAVEGTDYAVVDGFSITIPSGDASATATFPLAPIQDDLFEEEETLTVSGLLSGVTVTSTEVTITDDESEPSLTLSVAPSMVAENAVSTTVTVTATLDGSSRFPGAEIVAVTVGESGDSAVEGTDYAVVDGFSITIPSGDASATATFPLAPIQDALFEEEETLTVSGLLSGVTVTSTEVTITDDESEPSLTLSAAPSMVAENAVSTTVTVTATLDGSSRFPGAETVAVTVGESGDSAVEGTDYAVVDGFSITIPSGDASATATFPLAPIQDALFEEEETLTVSGLLSGVTVTSTEVTITDDESEPSLTLSAAPSMVAENAVSTTVTVTATLDGSSRFPGAETVAVTVGESGDSAVEGTDYAVVDGFSITIPSGDASATATFPLAPIQDALFEEEETLTVSGLLSGVTVTSTEVTITDDESEPSLTLSAAPSMVAENAVSTTVTVTATLDGSSRFPGAETVAVTVGESGDSAVEGTDYAVVDGFSITIPSGDASATATFPLAPIQDDLFEEEETLTVSGLLSGVTVTSTEVTITDDESEPSLTLSVAPSMVAENAVSTTVTVTATLDGSSRFPGAEIVAVTVGESGDSAVEGTDYAVVDGFSITIPSGDASATATFPLAPIQDALFEEEETLTVSGLLSGVTVTSTEVTITDDESEPSLTLSVAPSMVAENAVSTTVTVTATLDGSSRFPGAETVAVTVGESGDSAVEGTDYAVVDGFSITIPSGDASATATFPLAPIQDALFEEEETLTVSGLLSGVTVISTEVTITDDESEPSLTLSAAPSMVAENAVSTTVTVTATLDGSSRFPGAETVAVTVGESGDSAVEGTDYAVVDGFSITIPSGDASATATFPLAPIQDALFEEEETLTVSGLLSGVTVTSTEVTITDDESEPSLTLSAAPSMVAENAVSTTVTVTATLDGSSRFPGAETVAVTVGESGDSAVEGTDYAVVDGFSITIPSGDASATATFPLAPIQDALFEEEETLTVSGLLSGVTVTSTEVTITDDESEPSLTLSVAPSMVAENAVSTTVTVTATLDGSSRFPGAETVAVTVGESGDSAVEGTDYAVVDGFSITIPSGDASATATFPLAPIQDDLFEEEETLTVSGLLSGVTVTSTEVTITDDESEPSLTLSAAPSMVAENAVSTTVTVTATLDGSSRFPGAETVAVTVGESGDSAVEGTDYAVVDGFSITIPSGDASATATFPLAPIQDALFEEEETLTVSGLLSGVTVTSTEVTITDDESEPSLTLSVAPSMVAENAVSTTVTVTATLDGSSRFPGAETVAVTVGESGDSAVEGTDYAVVDGFSITIPSGDASATATFPLAPIQDALSEEEETLTVSGLLSGVTVTSTEVTITDDESEPSLTLSAAPSMVAENAVSTTVTVTATLDGSSRFPGAETVAVTVGESGDSAVEGTDYAVVDGFSITIPSGDASATATFPLAPIQDALFEEEETLTVSGLLSGVTVTSTEVTITDDESEPSLTLSVAPSMVAENAVSTTVTVTATLDGSSRFPGAETVAVTVGESGDSAVEGTDYAVVDGFSITIPSGDASATATFPLAPIQDALSEEEETLTVSGLLSGVTVTSTEVTITDDEAASTALVLTVSPNSAVESAGTATVGVTVRLDAGARVTDTDITLTVLDGTATSPGDYSASSSPVTLQIPTGMTEVTGTVPIVIVDDNIAEGDETLSIGAEATGLNSDSEDFTITDDDTPSTDLVVVLSQPSALESAGTATVDVTVSLDAGTRTSDTEVTLTVLDDEATSPADYSVTGSPFTLTIDAGDQSVTEPVPIVIVDDNIAEGDETLSIGAEATGLNSDSEDFTITDDDTPSTDLVVVLSQPSALESAGTATVDVTVSLDAGTRTSDTEVTLTVLDDEATSPADYSVTGSPFTLTIDAGDQSVTQPVPIVIVDDNIAEGDETLSIGAEATGLNSDSEDFTITNDDTSLSITLGVSPSSVAEDVGTPPVVTITATVDGGTFADPQTVMIRVGTSGDSAVEGTDYEVVDDFEIVIPAGDASATGTFTLAPVDDVFAEGEETLTVSGLLSSMTVTSAELTITDDDVASTDLVLTISPESAVESAGTATVGVTVRLDAGARATDTDITLTVSDGTATSPGDYSASSSPVTLQIPMGMTEVTGTVPIAIVNDDIAEGDETVTLRVEATGLSSDSEDFTIEDDDTSLSITLGVSPSSVAENVGTPPVVTVTATMDGGTFADPQAVMISVGTSGDSAVEGTDYEVVDDFSIIIPAGDASATGTFTLAPMDDAFAEGDETVTVSGLLSSVTVTSAELTITDDDAASTALELTISQPSALESAGTATVDVTVSLDAGTRTSDTEVTLTVLDDEATSPADYSVTGSPFTLTIDAGDQSVTQPVPIVIVDDNIAEGDETLSIGAEATGLNSDSEDFTITDDDTSLSVTLGVSPSSVAENVGTPPVVTVTATVDGGTFADPQAVMISVGTSGDSAVEGTDYEVVDDFEIVIPAGDASATDTFTLAPVDDVFAEGEETLTVSGLLSGVPVTATELTIMDDDAASTALVLTVSPDSGEEDAGTVDVGVTVRLDAGARAIDTDITLTVSDGSATSPGDYSASSSPVMLQIPMGITEVTGTVPIAIVNDDIAEGNETVTLEVEATGLTSASEDFTIEDDDTSLSVTLGVSPSSVAENVGTPPVVTVTATVDGGTFADPQAVMISVGTSGDSAVEGTDYEVVDDFEIVIPAGDASATDTFTLAPVDDVFAEGEETLTVSGLLSSMTVTSAELTITDDDVASTALVLTISPESAVESAGTATVGVTVRLDAGARATDTDITLTVSDGTATSPGDYSASSSPVSLQIPIGMTEVTGTVPIAIVNDDIAEGDETVTLRAEVTGLTSDSEDFTIEDDDTSLSITLGVSPSSVAEDVGTPPVVTVTATVDGGTFTDPQTVMVSVGTSGDSAVEGTDYAVVDDFEIMIPAGDASATGTFTLAPMDDAFAEGAETVTVSGLLSGVTVTSAELTITDDDAASTVLELTISPNSAVESAGTATVGVTVRLDAGARAMDTDINLTVSDGTATSPGDYSASSSPVSLQIPMGMTEVTGTVPIAIVNDDIAEGDETLTLRAEATGLTSDSEDFTIEDDDTSLSITLGASSSSVAEDVGTAPVVTVTATVDGGTFTDPQTVMVSVGASSDSAVEGTDYAVVDDFEIMIPAGDASATGTFTLAPMDDAFAEGQETVTVSGLLSGVTVTATELTITDDDAASTALVLTISPDSAEEDAGTVDVGVTVRLDAGARTTDTDITLTVLDGTATSPGDYSASSSPVTLQIPMGMTEVTGTVPIVIVNDDIAEGNETLTLRVEVTGLSSDSEDFTIEDDDTSLSVTLGVSPSSVAEDVGTAPVVTVTATVDGDTFTDPQTVMVSVGTSSDSAVEGTDYGVVDDFEIMIPAGDASATGTFTLAPVDDAFAEGDETLTVSGLLSGVTVTATELTITDDDAASTALLLTISPNSAVESAGTATVGVTVRLDAGARASPTDVTLTVLDGTATSPGDYSASSSTVTLQIPAGMVSVTGAVPLVIVNDNIAEGSETVTLRAEATGLSSDSEDFTITDDDAASTALLLTISPNSAVESAGTATVGVTVRLDAGARTSPTNITLTVLDGTATSPGDYSVSSSPVTLQIPAGTMSATGTVPIAIVNDNITEEDETLTLRAAATGLTSDSENFTITDNDAASTALVLTLSPNSAVESAGTANVGVTVRLDAGARTSPTNITLTVLDGTATSPGDYSVSSSTVTLQIPTGMTSVTGTVPIAIVDDNITEGPETVELVAAATGLTGDSEDFTITDDDAASTALVLTLSPESAEEDASTVDVDVTVRLDAGARTSPTDVTLTVSDGTATSPGDYSVSSPTVTLQIPAGMTSATETVPIVIVDDDIFEGAETVTLEAEATGFTSDSEDFTITDNEAPPSTALLLTISPESAREDAGTVSLSVTASLDAGASTEAISVTVSVTDGTAMSADYSVGSNPGPLEIPAGALEVTGTLDLVVLEDDIAEADETVLIGVSATGLTGASEDFTITDDDASLSVTLGVSPPRVTEDVGATAVTVTATVDGGRMFVGDQEVTVIVGALGDSAEEGTDYGVVDDFPIVIPAGDVSATGTFTLAPVDDEISEGEETLTVSGSLSGVTVTATPTELTITDDDAASTALELTISPDSGVEDAGTMDVGVTVRFDAGARPMDTPVDVSVTGGTATAGADYSVSVIPTLLTIPAGKMSISDSLQITITDDDTVEGDETIVIGVSVAGLTGTTQNLVIVDDEAAVRIDVLNVIAKDDSDYTITAIVRQNLGAPVASVVLYHGDGITFEETPMQTLVMGSSLYRAELMGPDEGGILYYYVVATNEDGLTSTYPPDGRYWDINDYIEGSRLVLLDFEDGDASDKSDVRHYVAYKGGAGALAEGVLALDGLDDHAEILGSSLGASEEFTLELMFNADDFDAGTLEGNGRYLAVKPAGCAACWGEPTFSLLWGNDGNSGTYVAARFWNRRYEAEQVGLEVPLPLVAGQWYHAVLEVQRDGAERRAVLQLRDTSGLLYGRDTAVLPVGPTISRYPIFVGHIGDRGFFDGRIDNIAFYNYAHFSMLTSGVENVREVPEGYVLEQNYPNPFNPVTTIRYGLAEVGHVRLEVSDLLGRRVALLVDEVQQAGVQEVRFDARDLPSGMYLYRLEAGDFVSVKKMVMLK